MMSKVYIFLTFMVLILPSLGLTRYLSPPAAPSSSQGLDHSVPRVADMALEDADP